MDELFRDTWLSLMSIVIQMYHIRHRSSLKEDRERERELSLDTLRNAARENKQRSRVALEHRYPAYNFQYATDIIIAHIACDRGYQ